MNLDFIPAWASAIAQFEGFNSPGSRPARNHNPGDLKFAGQPGATGVDSGGFAIFPDDVTGFQALQAQLAKYVADYPNDTLLDIMGHYLGQASPGITGQGNAYQYAAAVAGALGVPVTTTLAQLAGMGPSLPGPPTIDAATGQPVTDTVTEASAIDPSLLAAAAAAGFATPAFTTGEIIAIAAIGALLLWFAYKY